MKQLLPLLLLLQVLNSFASEWIPPKAERQFKITFEKVFVTSNPCVGDDWTFTLLVGDQIINEKEVIDVSVKKRSPLTIEAQALEDDPTHNDFGSKKLELTYSDLIAIEKNRFEIEVIVEENGGPNSGCVAVVKFWVEVKQI